jgi:hypothetical protein
LSSRQSVRSWMPSKDGTPLPCAGSGKETLSGRTRSRRGGRRTRRSLAAELSARRTERRRWVAFFGKTETT